MTKRKQIEGNSTLWCFFEITFSFVKSFKQLKKKKKFHAEVRKEFFFDHVARNFFRFWRAKNFEFWRFFLNSSSIKQVTSPRPNSSHQKPPKMIFHSRKLLSSTFFLFFCSSIDFPISTSNRISITICVRKWIVFSSILFAHQSFKSESERKKSESLFRSIC